MSAFDAAFALVVGSEGGYSTDQADPGNWTGGACGKGECRGTKYGISAAAYPTLDISSMTEAAARTIYQTDYWNNIAGDKLPPPLALLMFDAAVNSGVSRAARWLQMALGVAEDGAIGPETLAAVTAKSGQGAALMTEFLAQRVNYMAGLPTWRSFGLGWSRRLCALPFSAMTMG